SGGARTEGAGAPAQFRNAFQPFLLLSGHTQTVRGLVFSPDGRRLVSVACDGLHRLGRGKGWDVPTGPGGLMLRQPGGDVAFSRDGERLVVAGVGQEVRVWQGPRGRQQLTCRDAGRSVAFSPDGQWLATAGGGRDGVRLWNAKGRAVRTLKGQSEGYARGH